MPVSSHWRIYPQTQTTPACARCDKLYPADSPRRKGTPQDTSRLSPHGKTFEKKPEGKYFYPCKPFGVYITAVGFYFLRVEPAAFFISLSKNLSSEYMYTFSVLHIILHYGILRQEVL
jgi:hypothetical protein